MKKTTKEYINENWKNTIRYPSTDSDGSWFKMPAPYTTPCASTLFKNFFYWDTYFANLGLMADGYEKQAKNNLITMRYFIKILGFVPNADHIITRSQPPLFTRGVYDYYHKTGDIEFVKGSLFAIEREFGFFQSDRMTEIGLNAYGNNELNFGKKWYYSEFDRRLGGYTDDERKLPDNQLIDGLLAIAESGWDFNPRFKRQGNRFAAGDFVHLDLNCILFDAEVKASELFALCGEKEKSEKYREASLKRKKLIEKYTYDKTEGIYLDYDFKSENKSEVVSAASFYPYALEISSDKIGCEKLLEKLELPFGLAACEYRGENEKYWQWDYPSMWPTNVYFAYLALKNCGLSDDAERIAKKYLKTVDNCFEKTGDLWEKYDAKKACVSVTREYDTPEMMGWTAGVYRFLQEEYK